MRILSLAHARTGRRPGIPALVAVALLVSLLALPAAATDHVRRQGLGPRLPAATDPEGGQAGLRTTPGM